MLLPAVLSASSVSVGAVADTLRGMPHGSALFPYSAFRVG